MFEKIDTYILDQIEKNIIPGVVLLIAKNNKIIKESAYGYAKKYQLIVTPEDESLPYLEKMNQCKKQVNLPIKMTTEHLFDLASVTKVLATSFAIMLLLDQNKLQLDCSIKKYIHSFDKPDKKFITVRHLLSHTSGLAPWKPLYYYVNNKKDAIQLISELPLMFAPGSKRQYGDLDFMVLAYLIEKIADQSFDQFIQQYLYERINLTYTFFNPKPIEVAIVSTSHGNPFEYKMIADGEFGYPCEEKIEDFKSWRHYTFNGEVNDANAHHVFSGVSGHAGLFSTAADINKLIQIILNNGYHQQYSILKSNTIKHFITLHDYGHGLGWSMSGGSALGDLPLGKWTNDPLVKGAIGHTGFTGTFIFALPAKKLSIILLTNLQNGGVTEAGSYPNLKTFREVIIDEIFKQDNACMKYVSP